MARSPTPQVDVPTREEFDALVVRVDDLEGRVAVLEGDGSTAPQPPEPDRPPSSGTGTKAMRIADVVETFGVNTFSSMDENNRWGSWPADYRPEQVIAALQWMTNDSGHSLRLREYHYSGYESFQQPWLAQIRAALPDTRITLCVAANGNVDDVPSMLSMADFADWFEGLNEPNTDFGSGMVPVEQTMAIQHAVYKDATPTMGPSVVAGMPHPEGWITGYFGDRMAEVNEAMAIGNGHYYPPHCPDLTGDGTSLSEYVGGLWTAYGQHVIALTEFHPTLYNSDGHQPSAQAMSAQAQRVGPKRGQSAVGERKTEVPVNQAWSGDRDAYYTLLALLRAAKCGVDGLWWYALFDYGTVYICGLFPVNASNPRPAAQAIRNLCTACPDKDDERRTFEPDSLDVQVSGGSERCDWLLAESAVGRFSLFLWHSEPEAGGQAETVSVSLPYRMTVTETDLLSGAQTDHGATDALQIALPATVRVLTITP
jgi:hypothetical protein